MSQLCKGGPWHSSTLNRQKTDPFRVGCVVRVGATGLVTCPVSSVLAFLCVHSYEPGPLYRFEDGTFLTRAFIADLIQSALPSLHHANTHSFRIGGASAAASAGIPDCQIQVIGRWSSNAFVRYLRLPDSFVQGGGGGQQDEWLWFPF